MNLDNNQAVRELEAPEQTMSERRDAAAPAPRSRPMQLTPDDLAGEEGEGGILKWTVQLRLLPTGLFVRLFAFRDRNKPADKRRGRQGIQRRLSLLAEHGYLHRVPRAVSKGGEVSDCAYAITGAGLDELRGRGLLEGPPPYWRWALKLKSHYVAHAVMLSDVRVAIRHASALTPEVKVSRWIGEHELDWKDDARKFVLDLPFDVEEAPGQTRSVPWRADAAFLVAAGGGPKSVYFIECDRAGPGRSGEPVVPAKWHDRTSIVTKLFAARAAMSGAFRRLGAGRFGGLLFVLQAGPQRAENILRAALTHTPELAPYCRVTHQPLLHESFDAFLKKPIWRTATGELVTLAKEVSDPYPMKTSEVEDPANFERR